MTAAAEIKWGQLSYPTRELIADIDRDELDAILTRQIEASARNAGHEPIDGTAKVEIIEPSLIAEAPEGCMIARASVRCIEGGAR